MYKLLSIILIFSITLFGVDKNNLRYMSMSKDNINQWKDGVINYIYISDDDKHVGIIKAATKKWEDVSNVKFNYLGYMSKEIYSKFLFERPNNILTIEWDESLTGSGAGGTGEVYPTDNSIYYNKAIINLLPASYYYSDSDFLHLVVHELGHVLGMGHSDSKENSILYANPYISYDYIALRDDDIKFLEDMYGVSAEVKDYSKINYDNNPPSIEVNYTLSSNYVPSKLNINFTLFDKYSDNKISAKLYIFNNKSREIIMQDTIEGNSGDSFERTIQLKEDGTYTLFIGVDDEWEGYNHHDLTNSLSWSGSGFRTIFNKTDIIVKKSNSANTSYERVEEIDENSTKKVIIDEGKIYIVYQNRLDIYSLFTNELENSYFVGGIENIDIYGNYIYISLGVNGLSIVNKNTLKEVTKIESEGYTNSVFLKDKYLYLNKEDVGVEIYDIKKFQNPEFKDIVESKHKNYSIANDDNYIYIAEGKNGFRILSFKEDLVREVNKFNTFETQKIIVKDDYLYVDDYNEIKIFNAEDKRDLKLITYIKVLGGIKQFYILNNRLFILSNNEIIIYDISKTSNPKLVESKLFQSEITDFYVDDENLYLLENSTLRKVEIDDITKNSYIDISNEYSNNNIAVYDNYIYVVKVVRNIINGNGDYYENRYVFIYELKNQIPNLVSYIKIENYSYVNEIIASKNRVYLATDRGVKIIDTSNPKYPTISTIDENHEYGNIFVTYDKLYATTGYGLTIIDNLGSKNIIKDNNYISDNYILDLLVSNKYIYILNRDGLSIFKLDNKNDYLLVGKIELELNSYNAKMYMYDKYIFISNRDEIKVVDISNLNSIREVKSLTEKLEFKDKSIEDIFVKDDELYILTAYSVELFSLSSNSFIKEWQLNDNVTYSIFVKDKLLYLNGKYFRTINSSTKTKYDVETIELINIEQTQKENNISINLTNGWNLISLPTNKNLKNPLEFFNAKSIWSFKNNEWIENPLEIEYLEGFWVNLSQNGNYYFSGEEYIPDFNTTNNWSLIGTGKELNISELPSFDNILTFKDRWYLKDEISSINRGQGFWIK